MNREDNNSSRQFVKSSETFRVEKWRNGRKNKECIEKLVGNCIQINFDVLSCVVSSSFLVYDNWKKKMYTVLCNFGHRTTLREREGEEKEGDVGGTYEHPNSAKLLARSRLINCVINGDPGLLTQKKRIYFWPHSSRIISAGRHFNFII